MSTTPVKVETKRSIEILQLFKRVEKARLSVKEYFATRLTPISLSQYYRLKKRFEEQGEAGLGDQRLEGNARKLTDEQVQLVRGILAYNRHLPSAAVQRELRRQWKIDLDRSRIDQYRRQWGLTRAPSPPPPIQPEMVPFAGIEIFSALVHHVGILDAWNPLIQERLQQVKPTQRVDEETGRGDPSYARRRNGTFSARYNRIARIRHLKFASMDDKVKDKDFSRLSLYQTSGATLKRKNLAVLLLPLVTNNGAMRSLDKPLGNALAYACGYNYKTATIDKYLRELKYLQVATDLIDGNAQFWSRFWPSNGTDDKLACYYIDGNVKPLWSSKRCRKGKVSMLGRVMNCLEQVVLHDGFGRPIYFRTFSGQADLKKHALQSMEYLDALLQEGSERRLAKSPCTRALIFDSAGNAVQTLRAFSKSEYHYITILDANQIHPRKFKHLSTPQRYTYGEACLTEGRIELIDSKEPKYIYESRAVQVQWDNGRSCCLVTSIPAPIFGASDVVKAYFDRWPFNETSFAQMKSACCFFQVVGYGKKAVADETMLDRIQKLQMELRNLQEELQEPLSHIADKEQQLQALFDQERRLKEQSTIKEGKRIQSRANQKILELEQRHIGKMQREIKALEKPFQKQFNTLHQKSKEFARIQGKKEVYQVDVELDQLLTSFRLTLANLLAFFAQVILEEPSIEMNTLIQSTLFLSGSIEQHPEHRKIYLNKNKKEPQFMALLEKGLSKLNALKIRHPSGVVYEFELV